MTAVIRTNPRTSPSKGDRTMNAAVFRRPSGTRLPTPALATAAPDNPPISAWEELEGMPPYQVIRFHAMAPTRPARTTPASITSGWTIPLPTVRATFTPKPKAATKLKKAAHTTAWLGVSTRVETTVAMEFAASWKPLMKTKTRATRMTKTTRARGSIQMAILSVMLPDLQHDPLDHVDHVLTPVGDLLERLVDLFPLDHLDRISGVGEEPGDELLEEPVGLVF